MPAQSQPLDSETAREEVLAQLEYLIDELEALKAQLGLIPAAVLAGRPLESDPSFKEIYATLARMDEETYLPAISKPQRGGPLEIQLPNRNAFLHDVDWNEVEMPEILARAQSARRTLLKALRSMAPEAWQMPVLLDGERIDMLGLAYWITQQDTLLLQTAAHRLHESRLVDRSVSHGR